MKNDYIAYTERIFFKHELSKDLPINVYSMHMHSVFELIYIVKGDATYIIEDRKYKLKPGDLILIRPFQYHFIQIDSVTDYERYDILFDQKKHPIDGLDLIGSGVEVINLWGNPLAESVFQRIDRYQESCEEAEMERLLIHLISELFFSIHCFSDTLPGRGKSLSPLISEALRYINRSLFTIQNIQEIADHLYITESYLFRRFKEELHQTPKKYIMNKRLLLSRQRIRLGESPTAVCQSLGFGDYTSFYRNFRLLFGQSPSEYAAQQKAHPSESQLF